MVQPKKITSYTKNLAKSMGYALGDVFTKYNPTISSMGKDIKDTAQDLYSNIRDFDFKKGTTVDEKELKGTAKEVTDSIWKNTLDDLKSGKFYNKERKDEMGNEMMKALGFDMDDFNFDMNFDDDWGDFGDDDISVSDKVNISATEKSTAVIASVVDDVGYKISTSVSAASAESANYIVKSANKSTRALYSLNERGFSSINKSIGALNDTVASLGQFTGVMSQFFQNASLYYTNTTKTLNEMNQVIHEIAKNTTPLPSATNRQSKTNKGRFSDIIGYDGIINIDEYKELIKSNFNDSLVGMAAEMLDGDTGKNIKSGGLGMAKKFSPMEMITTKFVDSMLPKIFKESMSQFNESIKYSMSAGLAKMKSKGSKSLIGGMLMDLFVPKDGYRNSVNNGNYEKGPVAWDGIARKALTEVIPITLLKIYSAITGEPEMVYDYNSGKFKKTSSIRKDSQDNQLRYAREAGEDFKKDILEVMGIAQDKNLSKYKTKRDEASKNINNIEWEQKRRKDDQYKSSELEKLKRQIQKIDANVENYKKTNVDYINNQKATDDQLDKYFLNAFIKGGSDYMDLNEAKRRASRYESKAERDKYLKDYYKLDENTLDAMLSIINGSDRNKRRNANKFAGNVQRKRDEYGDYISREEATGTSLLGYLNNNFSNADGSVKRTGGVFGSDEFGHDQLFYLRGIYQYTGFLADNIDYIGKRSNKKRKMQKVKKNDNDINQINEQSVSSSPQAGERTREEANTYNQSQEDDLNSIFESEISDEERAKRDEESRNENRKKASKGFKAKYDFVLGKLKKVFGMDRDENGILNGALGRFYEKPFRAVANFITGLSDSIDRLIWGKSGDDEENGIFGSLIKSAKTKFSELMDKFGIKDFFKGFWSETKKKFRDMKKFVGDTVTEFFGSGTPEEEAPVNNGSAAHGRKVTKSGIVTVSEGELIVPSELNPYYHGRTDKAAQVRNEAKINKGFFGSFAEGGTVGGSKIENILNRILDTLQEAKTKTTEKYNKIKNEGKGHKVLREGFDRLLFGNPDENGKQDGGLIKFINIAFGGNKESVEKDKSIIQDEMKNIFKDAKDNKGSIGAGLLLGAGASLLTGAVVGPLFGAAIGGAVALTANSKSFQKVLFGAVDEETGEFKKGIFKKEVGEFFNKKLPKIGMGAGVGLLGGALMGSPILGAIAGATVSYVSTSEKAKKFLFGDETEDGIVPKELQKKMKAAAPNMAIGAIAGLALGPFGIGGNMIVGAGLGYLTTSQKFHDYMFGEDGKGGLAQTIHDKIIKNIDGIFHNTLNNITGLTKRLFRSGARTVKNFFEKKLKAAANGESNTLLGRAIGGVVRGTGKVVNSATNFVGNRLEGINNKLMGRNLNRGYNVYDKNLGRNMTAAERVEYRESTGRSYNSTFQSADQFMANASKEDLNKFKEDIQLLKDPKLIAKHNTNQAMKDMYKSFGKGLNPDDANKIGDLIRAGKFEKAQSYLSSLDMPIEDKQRYIKAMEEANKKVQNAKDTKSATNTLLKKYKKQGINLKNGNDIDAIGDLINDELKSSRFSEEVEAAEQEKKYQTNVLDLLDDIDNNLYKLAHNGEERPSNKNEEKKEESNKEDSTSSNSLDNLDGDDTPGDINTDSNTSRKPSIISRLKNKAKETKKTFMDMFGNVHQYSENNQGELEEEKNDSDTDNSRKQINEFMSGIKSIPVIGTAVAGMGGVFNLLKSKLFGDKEKDKKGLFGKLFDFLSGEDGPLKFITNFLAGNPVTAAISTIGKNITLGSVLSGIVAPMLLAGGFSGAFNGIASKLGELKTLKGNDTKSTLDDNRSTMIKGKQLKTDENGNFITNDKGEYLTVDGEYVSGAMKDVGTNTSLSTQLKKNLVNGALMGHGSVTTVVAKNAGKSLNKMTGGALTKVAEKVTSNGGMIGTILTMVSDALGKIPTILKKVQKVLPISDKLIDSSDTIVTTIYDKISDALPKMGSKLGSIAAKLGKAVVVLRIVYVVGRVVDSWGNAESILGITQKATVGQRIIAMLIALVNSLIPIIGDLIPDKVLVNIFMSIAPKLGIDVSGLEEQREAAEDEVNAYNEENGTNLSIEEYNQMNGRAGIVTKAKNGLKSLGKNIGQGFSKAGKAIKSGFGKTVSFVKGGLSEAKDTVTDTYTNIFNYMKAGDVKGLLTFNNADEDDGTGTTIIKNAASVGLRFLAFMPTMYVSVGKTVGKIFKTIAEKVKNIANVGKEERDKAKEMLLDKDSSLKDFLNVKENEDPENPMGKYEVAFRTINRLVMVPVMMAKRIGNSIKDAVGGVISKVKNSFNTIGNTQKLIDDRRVAGDFKGLWDVETQNEDPDNPVGGFTKGIIVISKLINTPNTMLHWVGNKIKDKFVSIVGKVKSSFEIIGNSMDEISDKVYAGDIEGLWNIEPKSDDPDNPVGGFSKAVVVAAKVINTPSAMLYWTGKKISDKFNQFGEYIGDNVSNLDTSIERLKNYAKEGDINSIWDAKLENVDGDPLKFIWNAAFGINKLFQSVIAIFNKIMGPVTDAIDTVTNTVGNIKDGVVGFAGDVKDKAVGAFNSAKNAVYGVANNAFQSVKSFISGGGSGVGDNNSSFVSQTDSSYKNMKLGNSTVGEKGCGPAVATMIAKEYGTNLSMKDAIKYAQKFQDNNGTNANYFPSVFSSLGIGSQQIDTNNVITNVERGNKVILMGSDKRNKSKSNSPFGPNNHYVVASEAKNGKITIMDPESNKKRTYDANKVLKNTNFALSTSIGASGTKESEDNKVPFNVFANPNAVTEETPSSFSNGNKPGTSQFGNSHNILNNKKKDDKDSNESNVIPGYVKKLTPVTTGRSGTNPDDIVLQNLGSFSMPTAEELNQWVARVADPNSPFNNNGDVFLEASKESGLDPRYILAHAALESGWGTSTIARDKNNYFGIGAFDSSPYASAYSFDSGLAAGIIGGANWIARNYYHGTSRNGAGQTSLYTMRWNNNNHQYATDPGWDSKIARIMAGAPENTDICYDDDAITQMNESGRYGQFGTSGNSGSNGGSYGSSSSSSSGSTGGLGILSTITNAFAKGFAKIFGGADSTETLSSGSNGGSYSSGVSNYTPSASAYKGSAKDQKALVEKMRSIEGTLDYDMNGYRNPDLGTADCSSTVNWAYKQVTGQDIGNNTDMILHSQNTRIVDQSDIPIQGGRNGSGPNIDNLMPGDLMLYSRPGGSYNAGRDYAVGHVEMYTGDGYVIGHGGPGKGPTVKPLSADAKSYIMAKRLIGIDDNIEEEEPNELLQRQNGLGTNKTSSSFADQITSSKKSNTPDFRSIIQNGPINNSGNIFSSTMIPYNNSASGSGIGKSQRTLLNVDLSRYSAAGSGIPVTTSNNPLVNNVVSRVKSHINTIQGTSSYNSNNRNNTKNRGSIPAELVTKFLEAIISVLENINTNTSNIDKIYNALVSFINNGGLNTTTVVQQSPVSAGGSNTNKSNNTTIISGSQNTEIDSNIKALVGSLAAIAKG